MSDKKKTALTIRIDDDLLQAFKKACDDKDYSQSLVIRELIKKWLVDKKQGLQAGVERRASHCRAGAEHQPHLPMLRACVCRQSQDASQVRLYGMRL